MGRVSVTYESCRTERAVSSDVQHIIFEKRPIYMEKEAAKQTHIYGKRSCKRNPYTWKKELQKRLMFST